MLTEDGGQDAPATRAFDGEPIDEMLGAAGPGSRLRLSPSLWGFGGVHGGLGLALLASAMRRQAAGRTLRSISGQFRRPLRADFEIAVRDEGAGRAVSWLSAEASVRGSTAVSARAVFAARGGVDLPSGASTKPAAPPPETCPVFTIPRELVPFAHRTEIRPVGAARPFAGTTPELVAWLRLVEDDLPPDETRLIVMMDALAPSYTAVLRAPIPVPTVTYSLSFGAGLAAAASPWILLRARTDAVSRDGWLCERLDAWGLDGQHLAAGEQLRVLTGQP